MKTITYLIMIMVITIIAASLDTLVNDAWCVFGTDAPVFLLRGLSALL